MGGEDEHPPREFNYSNYLWASQVETEISVVNECQKVIEYVTNIYVTNIKFRVQKPNKTASDISFLLRLMESDTMVWQIKEFQVRASYNFHAVFSAV